MAWIEIEKKPYKKEKTTGQRRDELSQAYNLYRINNHLKRIINGICRTP